MSYVALYRKWRPKTFDEVRGQDAIVTTLKNQIKSGRIGHAYLFCGTRGTGKTSVAKIFARAVNCSNNEDGNPCNVCGVCESILSDTSMNVVEIDAASNNGVDNIREIREQVQYPPTDGKYKVFIIDEVHMLSTGAFNALLKTLEEPPEYVIFILATTEVHKIPVTVLSRCQRYDFKRISAETIAERLKELTDAEHIDIEDKAIKLLAKNADGAMRDAISLLDECSAFHPNEKITYGGVLEVLGNTDTETFAKLCNAIAQARTVDALKVVEEAVNAGRELSNFASDFLWYLRNLLIIKSTDDVGDIIDASKDNLDMMRESAEMITMEALSRYIKIFAELSNSMKFSGQKRVLLELAIVKLMTPQMQEDMDSVLERLSKLERGYVAPAQQVRTVIRSTEISPGENAAVKTDASKAKETDENEPDTEAPAAPAKNFLTHDWSSIVRSLGGLSASLLKDTSVEKETDNKFYVVFHNAGCFNLDIKDEVFDKLTDVVKERYGKTIKFTAKLADDEGIKNGAYASREEIESVIKMPIEFED